jgi:hypothetical protein
LIGCLVLGLGFVTFADVDGHYICAGSKAQCQAVADALDQARAALKSDNLSKDQRAALNRVVSTFGKAGDEHDGVTISFGKTQSAKATADAHSYKDDDGLLKTDITFNSAFFGSLNTIEVAGVLVHERSHGIGGIARGNMDPQNRKQEFRSFIVNFKPLPYWGFVLNSSVRRESSKTLCLVCSKCIGGFLDQRTVRLSAQCFSVTRQMRPV